MKKQWFLNAFALAGLLSAGALYADEMDSSEGSDQPSSTAHMNSTYDRIKGKEITPNAGPIVSGGADIYVEASYIYWYMNELGRDYAGTNCLYNGVIANPDLTSNFVPTPGRVHTPGNKASSGFKVGAGMDFDYDGWDSGVTYTWYRNHHFDSVASPLDADGNPTGNIASLYNSNSQIDQLINVAVNDAVNDAMPITYASNDFKLAMNIIDWEVGRSFFVSPKLVLRPHMGLKAYWGHQYSNWSNLFSSEEGFLYPIDFAVLDAGEVLLTSYNRQGTWGLGARCGLDMSWMMTKCFSFFTECSLTTLWQYTRTTRADVYDGAVGTIANPTEVLFSNWTDLNYHQRLHMVNPVVETQIGMRIDYMFSDDEYRFRLQAGWESQVWFNQNTFLNEFGANHAYGDLMLQGLTVNVRLDF